ncbi:FHA domain-containing protein [Marinitoga sp. 1155]|uniref:FHA domain-containing protein n=1 Tax=Marinitoga sp. 1155 TaxID=1428448 RepID=UPI000640F9AB|nr:FHA domain-containing protein [Marinitoga sp. 1155]KLO23518.1 hypothetical protein X274_06430 [Marinitoga sp. 1155]
MIEANKEILKMFEKVKICPSCNTVYGEDVYTCKKDDESLIEEDLIKAVKICKKCGEINSPLSKECRKCKEILAEEDIFKYKDLILLKTKELTIYIYNNIIVGRKYFPKNFQGREYISREHGKFLKETEDWYLIRLEKSKNPIYVNEKELQKNEKIKLEKGFKIRFSRMTQEFELYI